MLQFASLLLGELLALALILSPLVATNIILAEYVGTHQKWVINYVVHNS